MKFVSHRVTTSPQSCRCTAIHLLYSLLLLSLHLTSFTRAAEPVPTGSVLGEDDRSMLLNLINPCAIAAAVFGAPAVPYVIPCTILRRIRLFRETLSPSSSPASSSAASSAAASFAQPVTSVISGLMTDRQKLLIGNFILGTSASSSSASSPSIFKR